jgi:hypothetical protein
MDPRRHWLMPAGLDEGVEVCGTEAHELAELVVADPSLEDEAPHERLGHPQIGGGTGDVEQSVGVSRKDVCRPTAATAG